MRKRDVREHEVVVRPKPGHVFLSYIAGSENEGVITAPNGMKWKLS